jgi:hypothetical protein
LYKDPFLYFDPDRHDPCDFYENAFEDSIEFYQMLEQMRNRTFLSVVAGMFHEWDKELREWIIKKSFSPLSDKGKKRIWGCQFHEIMESISTDN